MTFVVTGKCYDCKHTDCAEVCPVGAFHEGPNMLYINPDQCIDCHACVEVCPENAIYPEVELPSDQVNYAAINARMSRRFPLINKRLRATP